MSQVNGATSSQVARNAFEQLKPLLESKQNAAASSQVSSAGFNTAASSGAGGHSGYSSQIQPSGQMSHTQRLGAVQNNSNGRQASVGSVGQKMVQVHSQDSRVGHANVLNSVLSGAQSLKIQKRKANESKLNPAVGGM